MLGTSVLGTVWYNTHGSEATFTIPVVLTSGGGDGDASGPGTRLLSLTDDVISPLDKLAAARPIATFDCIRAVQE